MKALIGQIVGAWAAFATIALFVRVAAPKNTAITCAYCGTPVLMATAQAGGIGAVNLAMREHIEQCDGHPLHQARWELKNARGALKSIRGECEMALGPALSSTLLGQDSDHERELRRVIARVGDIAGRNF